MIRRAFVAAALCASFGAGRLIASCAVEQCVQTAVVAWDSPAQCVEFSMGTAFNLFDTIWFTGSPMQSTTPATMIAARYRTWDKTNCAPINYPTPTNLTGPPGPFGNKNLIQQACLSS